MKVSPFFFLLLICGAASQNTPFSQSSCCDVTKGNDLALSTPYKYTAKCASTFSSRLIGWLFNFYMLQKIQKRRISPSEDVFPPCCRFTFWYTARRLSGLCCNSHRRRRNFPDVSLASPRLRHPRCQRSAPPPPTSSSSSWINRSNQSMRGARSSLRVGNVCKAATYRLFWMIDEPNR